jgi:hypothetical protein
MYFDFTYNFCVKHFYIVRRIERDMIKVYIALHEKYSCPTLMNLEFSCQIFEKFSNIKFHENPSHGSRVFQCERTDGQM